MLLTRTTCYGLIAVKHLAEEPRESSFSTKDLADFHGFPQEALAKILQRLARTGLLLSHHGIKAIEGAPRDGIRGKHWQHLESVAGYHQLHMVSQIVEDALRRVMISDIKEQASSPTGSCDARRC
jgi:hypothetical protein